MDEALDGVSCRIIPCLLKNRTGDGRDSRLKQAGDLPGNDDLPSGGQHLAGHTGKGVVRKAFVLYTVGYEVAQLIRMPFRNRFGGIELVHGILLLYRS